jgi:catechol 2,3-dioxygenase-like lactoylglutathione lyase family enzyme
MTRPTIASISPCFLVRDVTAAISFYRDMLGFNIDYRHPDTDPFFAIVRHDSAIIFVKSVGVDPVPNRTRHPWAGWDAYVSVPDPDGLAAEVASRGVTFLKPLEDTSDGLRGFEVKDADGYVLFFGRPREKVKE